DETPPRRRAPWIVRFIGGIVGLSILSLVVLASAAAGSYFIVFQYIRGQDEEVPNLVGRPVAEAMEELAALGLGVAFETGEYHTEVAEGAIIRQHPRPYHTAKRGTSVRVVVSRGPAFAEIPDVTGLSVIDAGMVIRANDLRVGSVARIPSDTRALDDVIAQSPEAGEGLRRGEAVNLLVSTGPAPVVMAAPNLQGLTVPEAEQVLARIGCALGSVAERDTELDVESGTILEQLPRAGMPFEEGQRVNVVIARRLLPPGPPQFP
ncbi:PASTA domain-containing protein, partial [Candidatus Sumerlaeota bacterium]|nr:PASTA domain-containing protein [Candidatus Sumerlaeota bacterium]